jgi:hypothetical protein
MQFKVTEADQEEWKAYQKMQEAVKKIDDDQ